MGLLLPQPWSRRAVEAKCFGVRVAGRQVAAARLIAHKRAAAAFHEALKDKLVAAARERSEVSVVSLGDVEVQQVSRREHL